MEMSAENQRLVASIRRVRRVFALGLAAVAFLWLVVIPTQDIHRRYRQTRLESEIRLGLVADKVSSFIAANMDTWEFESIRLPSVVTGALRGSSVQPWRLAFVHRSGAVEGFPAQGTRGTFNLDLEERVTDGRNEVGRMEMAVSLDNALLPAAFSAGLGVLSMALLLGLARMVGRRALDGSLAAIEDVTRRLADRVEEVEEARRRLADHSAELKMANQDITHVALLTTHHLREPLRTIQSYAQLLVRHYEEKGVDETAAGHLAFLKGGVDRMQAQLRALGGYLSLRERTPSPGRVALIDVVRAAAAQWPAGVGPVVAAGPLPTVRGDSELLLRLFSDLFTFALRHRWGDGPVNIEVEARRVGDRWEIAVFDDGVPLAQRDPDRLFHLLVHAEGGTMVEGLAAARMIVFLLGGTLWGEPTGERGAVFRFTLPAYSATTGAGEGAGAQEVGRPSSSGG